VRPRHDYRDGPSPEETAATVGIFAAAFISLPALLFGLVLVPLVKPLRL
jgi:uncharacterized protein YqgC (DUF456 family)